MGSSASPPSDFSSSSLLSWLTKRNDTSTTQAPTQYIQLEYCAYWIISPMSDSGIVSESPTVTISGVVKSMAYAQDMSLIKEESELSRMMAQTFPVGGMAN